MGLKVMTEDSGEIWMRAESTRGKARETEGRKLGWSEGTKADRKGQGVKTDSTNMALKCDCETGWAKKHLRSVKGTAVTL